MTISSLPVATNPTVAGADIGIAVMAKSLDTSKQAGEGMVKMMEQSVTPHLGQTIDTRI